VILEIGSFGLKRRDIVCNYRGFLKITAKAPKLEARVGFGTLRE
jgi:hypothetical protein